jgi:hypothetical protein
MRHLSGRTPLSERDILIAAKEIGRVEFRFERHQSVVVYPVRFTYAMAFALVERIDVDLAGIERLHCGKRTKGL